MKTKQKYPSFYIRVHSSKIKNHKYLIERVPKIIEWVKIRYNQENSDFATIIGDINDKYLKNKTTLKIMFYENKNSTF